MRTAWEKKTLGEACLIKPAKAEARRTLSASALVSFVPMEDLGIDRKFLAARHSKPMADVVDGYTYFAEGDVLLAKITPCFENGKLGIAANLTNGIGFGSSEYVVFRPESALSSEWLYYFLSREEFRIEGSQRMSGAVGHKRVAKEFIEACEIPLPPLPEQQRIVAILDEAFEGIATAKANAEKNLQNAGALFDSHLNSVDGVRVPLGDFVKITTGRLDANAAVEDGRYPFFTCSREIYAIDDYAFDCEAILLAGNNAVGDFNVKHYKGKFNAYQRTYVITVSAHAGLLLLYRFLYFQMLKSLASFKVQSVGAGTKFLKLGMIKELEIALPSLPEQQQIVSTLDALGIETQRLESIYCQKLAALEALKKSLLDQAFTGAL